MNKTKLFLKKGLCVFLSLLMCLSMFSILQGAFIKAEAATAGKYDVYLKLHSNHDGHKIDHSWFYIDVRQDNGTGASERIVSQYGDDKSFIDNKGSDRDCYWYNTGFPVNVHHHYKASRKWGLNVGYSLWLYVRPANTSVPWTLINDASQHDKGDGKDRHHDFFTPNDKYPAASSVISSPTDVYVTVPSSTTENSVRVSAKILDQYGVQMALDPNYSLSYQQNGLRISGDTVYVSNALKDWVAANGTQRDVTVTPKYNVSGGSITGANIKVHITNVRYAATFVNHDDTVLQGPVYYFYKQTPSYSQPEPKKPKTPQYTYTFSGWSPAIAPITRDTEYKAQYTAHIRYYQVQWKNYNGAVLKTASVAYGTTPTYDGETPTKPATAQYTYTFSGWDKDIVAVTGDITYTAQYTQTVNKYTVTWKNYDGAVLETDLGVKYGDTPAYDGEMPKKPETPQYTYTFSGWYPQIADVTDNVTYTARYTEITKKYTVTWKNYDGAVLKTAEVAYGDMPPAYDGETPERLPTDQYTYTFSGWDRPIAQVTENVTYTARYTRTVNKYTVTWKNYDGSLIDSAEIEYGKIPTHADPTKAADAQYTYTFVGWEPEIVAVTADATYTAKFDKTINKYTVTWENYNGAVLETAEVAYGDTPAYNGELPERLPTAQYTYTFSGWDPQITAVTEEATYTAQYTSTVNTYTVTWENYDGDVLETDFGVEYGVMPEYNGGTPERLATAEYTYTFSGWDKDIAAVTEDATYTAQYTSTVNKYTVTWKNYDGAVLETDFEVVYGTTPTYDGGTPSKPATAQYTYTFAGWYPQIAEVEGDVTYTAQYTQTVNTYTVTWKNYDGTVLETDFEVVYGTTPTYDGETPTKPATAQYTFTFFGWSPQIVLVEDDITYTAIYEFTTNPYNVFWINYDGTLLYTSKDVLYNDTPVYGGETPERPDDNQYSYTFAGWYPEIAPVTDLTTYTATYTGSLRNYRLVYDTAGGSPAPAEREYTYNDVFNLAPAPSRTGYDFGGWSPTAPNGWTGVYEAETEVREMYGDVTLKAIWKPIEYTLSYDACGGAPVPQICGYTIEDDLNIAAAPTKTGYTFVNWKVQSASGNWAEDETFGAESAVAAGKRGDVTLAAQWEINNYTITFEPDGGEVDPTSKIYTITTSVTLPEPAKTGYIFAGWKVAQGSGAWAENEILSAESAVAPGRYGDVTLTAQWETISYTIKLLPNEGEVSQTTINYTIEDSVALPEPVRAGHTFNGWKVKEDSGGWTTADPLYPAAALDAGKWGDVTLAAQWTINTYTVTWVNYDGETIKTDENVPYDTVPHFDGETPKREWTEHYAYFFNDWQQSDCETTGLFPIKGDALCTATYTTVEIYEVVFVTYINNPDTHMTEEKTYVQTLLCGSQAEPPAEVATYYDENFHYTFANWSHSCEELSSITADTPGLENFKLRVTAFYAGAPHSYSVENTATCTEAGLWIYHCEYCGRTYDEPAAAKGHIWIEIRDEEHLTRPVLDSNGDWLAGYYTFECARDHSHTMEEPIGRADYTAYDEARERLNDLLTRDITDEARQAIENALDENDLPLNYIHIPPEQELIDEATAKLNEAYEANKDQIIRIIIDAQDVYWAGRILDVSAHYYPTGAPIPNDALWFSSDTSIVTVVGDKLIAHGLGTVRITTTDGRRIASKTIRVIEPEDLRAVTFINTKRMHYIVEDFYAVFDTIAFYWARGSDLHFRVRTYEQYKFDSFFVILDGERIEPDENGYFTVPAGANNVYVTITPAVLVPEETDPNAGGGETVYKKLSFWDLILAFFRRIIDFFRSLVK